jgi:hypothetical protein
MALTFLPHPRLALCGWNQRYFFLVRLNSGVNLGNRCLRSAETGRQQAKTIDVAVGPWQSGGSDWRRQRSFRGKSAEPWLTEAAPRNASALEAGTLGKGSGPRCLMRVSVIELMRR